MRVEVQTPIQGGNERCVEIPLGLQVADLETPGWVLDAGCALNGHLPIVGCASVVHLTQNIQSEKQYLSEAKRSYVSGDLRDLRIFTDGAFDRTVCISTLEHVGLDNASYHGPRESNPASAILAFLELLRVTRHRLLVTVPFGWKGEVFDAWRFFDRDGIDELRDCAIDAGYQVHISYYGKHADGHWHRGPSRQPSEDEPLDIPDGTVAGVTQVAVAYGIR
jgi:hypothetical protein